MRRLDSSLSSRRESMPSKALTSSVNVTVTILDQNDNQPLFFGYDRLAQHNGLHTVPVYTSHINSYRVDAGVMVAEVFANDTDTVAHGNGVVEFKLVDEALIPAVLDHLQESFFPDEPISR